MKKTLVTHFYNEEYLLPWWLNHHKNYFDHAILLDYNSTDNSCDIIRSICPHWEIRKSRNEHFQANLVDHEVFDTEKDIDGFRMCLNITEFVYGNFEILKEFENEQKQLRIGAHVMIDPPELMFKDVKEDLLKERTYGLSLDDSYPLRQCRSLHNFSYQYGVGRHIDERTTEDIKIMWYGFSPITEPFLQRKLQIQTRQTAVDVALLWGTQHRTNREGLLRTIADLQQKHNIIDLSSPQAEII